MDNHNQVIKFFGICGKKRVYNAYHRLNNPCNLCIAKNSAQYYQVKKDKFFARSNFYQENRKLVRKSHLQQIEELNNKIEELTRVMETLILKKWTDYINNKYQSYTTHIANFLEKWLLKNNGINFFILVDVYIEKSMDIGQPNFHKEN